jgi:glycosyltransferase involved in cell wall biosynthesis
MALVRIASMTQTLPNVDTNVDPLDALGDGVELHSVGPTSLNAMATTIAADQLVRLAADAHERPTLVELAIPVHNEEKSLEFNVRRLRTYLDESFPFPTSITIVDNASTDATRLIAEGLAMNVPGVSVMSLDEKGKGRAIRAAWSASKAEIVAYMDVDLSTDLGAFLPLVAPLVSGHSDLAIGSRFAPGAHVLRGARREVVSRGYNLLLRAALRNRFSDATCGFKAARREAAAILLPMVDDEHWFFDTELLIAAERNGFRIHEVAVDWIDEADSRVNIKSVASDDLRGIVRIMRARVSGRERVAASTSTKPHASQGTRYASVGILSTLVYLVAFFLLRNSLGTYLSNVTAVAISTVVNTIAHVRFTFGPRSGVHLGQASVAALAAFVAGVSLTSVVLVVEAAFGPPSAVGELGAIVFGIVGASFVRLVLLRAVAYRVHTRANPRPAEVAHAA